MNIFQYTRLAIKSWLEEDLREFPFNTKIAVFGNASYARFIVQNLLAMGYKNTCLTVSYPLSQRLDGFDVISVWDLEANGIDLVISGSLSNTEGQLQFLRADAGINLPFIGIRDGARLCVDPLVDRCDPERLSMLKNRHKGERFYIVANGPSLNDTPPEKLTNGIRLAANGIVHRDGFIPEYYFMLDQICLDLWESQVREIPAPIILGSHIKGLDDSDQSLYRFPVCFSAFDDIIDPYESGIPVGGTVVNAMMYFATYMGASEIVTIGLDNNYHGSKSHFCDDYHPKSIPKLQDDRREWWEERQARGIKSTVELVQRQGVKVFDATAVNNNLGLKKLTFENAVKLAPIKVL